MACNNYLPVFQKQLRSDDPLGSLNCTCYSGAMALDYHTCGARRVTGEKIRTLTGDRVGGTTLIQIDSAIYRNYGINLDTRVGSAKLTWAQFANKINIGHGAILQGGYSAIYQTRFSGSRTFTGNHAVFVPPRWKCMDPLCDGRRWNIYKYRGEAYPTSLLKDFAGRLMLDPVLGRRLGYGYVWCSLTRDNISNIVYKYRVHVPRTTFLRYKLSNGIIVDYDEHKTGGFSASSSGPKVYPASSRAGLPFKSRTLVLVKTGAYAGWFIASRYAQEI